MSFGDLVYSLFNSKTNSNTGLENSIAISQGKEYKNYKSYKNDNNVQNDNHAKNGGIEGFSGMIGPTSVNTKNQNEQYQLQTNEDELNRKISSYANSQRNLIEKTQQYLQNKRIYGKNIFALEAAKMEDIRPSWVGCYKTKNDGLVEQTDLGNNVSVNSCKVRASDLGYSTFSLRQDEQNGTKCYVGNNFDKAQSSGLATVPVVSHKFSTSEGANTGGLLMNGQIGVYEDDITTNLVTDLNAVPNCDISIGGKINANTTVATWGYNCNGIEKSKFTPPPPQPKPETPIPAGYKKYNATDGTHNLMRLKTTDINELAKVCNKNNKCLGFNNVGYLKKSSTIEKSNKIRNGVPVDLYMKHKDTEKSLIPEIPEGSTINFAHPNGKVWVYNKKQDLIHLNNGNKIEMTIYNNSAVYKNSDKFVGLKNILNNSFIRHASYNLHSNNFIPNNFDFAYKFIKQNDGTYKLYNDYDGGYYVGYDSRTDNVLIVPSNDNRIVNWKMIISKPSTKCDQYKDTDKNLPNECLQQIWNDSGCTTNINDAFGDEHPWWKAQTKAVVKSDMRAWATMTDATHRSHCYAPVPVIKTGSTINTGSLWKKPWVRINDGTNAFSIGQINDGSIICANSGGVTYTRANLSVPWKSYPTNIPIKSYIQLLDGRYLGVGKNDNSLYIKNKLNEKWNGFNPSSITNKNPVRYIKVNANPGGECLQMSQLAVYSNGVNIAPGKKVSAPNVYSSGARARWVKATNANDGRLNTKDYPNIYTSACKKGDYWQLDLGKEYDVDEIVYYNRRDCCQSRASGMVVQIFDNNMSQSQFTQGNFTLNSDMKQVITLNNTQTPPSGCCILSIIQLNNGTLIGVGTNNYLYRKETINDTKWKQIKCPSSCCVTSISKLSDGYTIVAVGTNGYIYTRVDGEGWILVDQSMRMSAVTQLKDGTILGLDQNGNFFKK